MLRIQRIESLVAARREPPAEAARTWAFVGKTGPARTQSELLVEQIDNTHLELHDEHTFVVVLAHLPGVREDEIRQQARGDLFALWTEPHAPNGRRYEAEAVFPFPVAPEPRRRSFKNGIFELEFARDVPHGHESPESDSEGAGAGRGAANAGGESGEPGGGPDGARRR